MILPITQKSWKIRFILNLNFLHFYDTKWGNFFLIDWEIRCRMKLYLTWEWISSIVFDIILVLVKFQLSTFRSPPRGKHRAAETFYHRLLVSPPKIFRANKIFGTNFFFSSKLSKLIFLGYIAYHWSYHYTNGFISSHSNPTLKLSCILGQNISTVSIGSAR